MLRSWSRDFATARSMAPVIHSSRLPNTPPPSSVRKTVFTPVWDAFRIAAQIVASYAESRINFAKSVQASVGCLPYATGKPEQYACET